jgi:hypothetical protein
MATIVDDLKRAPFIRVDADAPGGTPTQKYTDPDLGTEIIPKERYISPAFMKLEWERMWTKTWMIGGRHEVIPEPGDWMSHEIGTESMVFVRQPDMTIKGFFNIAVIALLPRTPAVAPRRLNVAITTGNGRPTASCSTCPTAKPSRNWQDATHWG